MQKPYERLHQAKIRNTDLEIVDETPVTSHNFMHYLRNSKNNQRRVMVQEDIPEEIYSEMEDRASEKENKSDLKNSDKNEESYSDNFDKTATSLDPT